MQEKEFNLLEEPWIRVLAADLSVKEVNLVDALVHAQEYKALAGEMPTQDVAMLRLLIACAETVFYRYDAEGEEVGISSQDSDYNSVMERWEAYWKKGKLPEAAVRGYLKKYEDRFWLFHPETPFFQVADLAYGTDYGTQSLYGNLKSSNNKKTKYHFSMNDGSEIQSMSYPEAARWLLNLNAFSVNMKVAKQDPSGPKSAAGVGRLGRLGLIYVDGQSLFELIMLNLTPLNGEEVWEDPRPIWEQPVRTAQSVQIVSPDNLPELYTLQSRRIMLKRENGRVTGFRAMNGDFFSYEDAFTEQMTLWKKNEDKKTGHTSYLPKQHSAQIQAWREFPTVFDARKMPHLPGVVNWIKEVTNRGLALKNTLVTFHTVGMVYGDGMSYTYGDCISDSITLSSELLKGFSGQWITRITEEIEKCKSVTDTAIRPFGQMVGQVLNEDNSRAIQDQLSANYYSLIDQPFRDWLKSIKLNEDQKDTEMDQWGRQSYYYARQVIEEFLETQTSNFYKSRETKSKIRSIPQAYSWFLWKLGTLYPNVNKNPGKE